MNDKSNISQAVEIIGPSKGFESIKKVDENGVEYWTARELAQVLGYTEWRNFSIVINRAKRSCLSSSQNLADHFVDINKMTQIGSGIVRKLDDFKLDRYACYLIAQNGDSTKPQIALAQTYFAIQTRRQEIFQNLSDKEKRIHMRSDVADKNRFLFSAAKQAGVSHFSLFNDAGYKGLYGMPLSQIEEKKNIITQTEAKLKREQVRGDLDARKTHQQVGEKVRQTIKDLGGTMPENLKPEKHIREVKKELKAAGRTGRRQLK